MLIKSCHQFFKLGRTFFSGFSNKINYYLVFPEIIIWFFLKLLSGFSWNYCLVFPLSNVAASLWPNSFNTLSLTCSLRCQHSRSVHPVTHRHLKDLYYLKDIPRIVVMPSQILLLLFLPVYNFFFFFSLFFLLFRYYPYCSQVSSHLTHHMFNAVVG